MLRQIGNQRNPSESILAFGRRFSCLCALVNLIAMAIMDTARALTNSAQHRLMRQSGYRVFFTIILLSWLAGLVSVPLMASGDAPPIRIMPLGASITKGVPIPGGYRAPLYHQLTNAGYAVDFLGTLRGSTQANMPDVDHEGHMGYRLDQVDAGFTAWADQVADPDIIVLLAGANDFAQNQDVKNMTNRLDHLITRITQNRPQARLIVCGLFRRTDYPDLNEKMLKLYNPFVPGIVARHAARGEQVRFLDLYPALTADDLVEDGLHPNQSGYNKIATNLFTVITNLITPLGVTNPPTMTWAKGNDAWNQITVTFNKPLLAESVVAKNFSVNGLEVLSATLDPKSQREVVLTTTPQTPSGNYTITVSEVRELMPPHRAIAPQSTLTFQARPTTGALNNVPEAAKYNLVYSLNIPNEGNFSSAPAPYEVDNHSSVGSFSRVAYYLELQSTNGTLDYVWVSMDAFTTDAGRIGVPVRSSGAFFQQRVTNLNVFSSVRSLVKGVGLTGGYLEFWPNACNPDNAAGLPNASSLLYDFSDKPSAGDYGSMQVHNIEAAQTIFAFNHWANRTIDVGIGNGPFGHPDWTLAANAPRYSRKLLQVLVLPERNGQ